MSIDKYIIDLEALISSHSFVSSYSLTIDRKTQDIAFISGLESKGAVIEKYLYGYNHRSGGTVIFRYDNSPDPHARNLNTFPHHKHIQGGKLAESDSRIDLTAVLEEIEAAYAGKED